MKAILTNTTLRIIFDGDLLSTNVAALRTELLAHIQNHPDASTIIADLSQASFVDSQGLNLIVALLRESERRKVAFRVENPGPEIHRLITLLNLSERLGLAASSLP